jgi:amino acid transporter
VTRSKFVDPAKVDLLSGKFEEEVSETWEESSRSGWKKMLNKIF